MRHAALPRVLCLVAILGLTPWLASAEVTHRGELALETRIFPQEPRDQRISRESLAMFARIELDGRHAPVGWRVRGFGRYDEFDRARSLLAVEEGWIQVRASALRTRIGFDLVNWSTMEAFHPADVINARNWNSELENFEKLGEPMVQTELEIASGLSLIAMLLPRYTRPKLTSPNSPLHFGIPGEPFPTRILVNRNGFVTPSDYGLQAALALRFTLGNADLSLHLLEHMDRSQPWFSTVTPAVVFQTVRQAGGTYQQVIGPLIFKAEAAYRSFVPLGTQASRLFGGGPSRDHLLVASGLEYVIAQPNGSEGNAVFEVQAVLLAQDAAVRRSLTPFPLHALLGYRWALNDEADRQLQLGVIFGLETFFKSFEEPRRAELLGNLSYRQRLGETWTAVGAVRLFLAPEAETGASPLGMRALRRASHVRIDITRHF